jgi:hypothetical protein
MVIELSGYKLISSKSRSAVCLNRPCVQWVPGIKWLEHEPDHTPTSSAKVKNVELPSLWICLHGMGLN